MLTREEAWTKLCEWTHSPSLRRHARAVEIAMRRAAYRYGAGVSDEECFAMAGLLHDADYELFPQEHPARVVAWLRARGEEEIAYAISAHYTGWGVPPRTQLDKCLLACDEPTGFIMACCLVNPDGIRGLAPDSVLRRLKDRRFAAKVERAEVAAGANLLQVDLPDHICFLIDALLPHAQELGLGGRPKVGR